MEGDAAGHSNKDCSWERVWLADAIEPEPSSEKPVSIIRENSAKQPLQEHGVKSILLSWASLILAFAGSSVSMLLMDYAYDLPFLQIINSNNIGIAVMQGLSGSFGIVLSVPVTVIFAAFVYCRKK